MTAAPPIAAPAAPRRRRRLAYGALAIAATVLLAIVVGRGLREREKAPPGGARGAAGPQDRPVPVETAAATTRDLPIALEGLGSVIAYKTVNVKAQVDGRLDRVAFREGQAVKRGDLLAQIDPRPFTIQLHQAEAALARDEAQLAGAERNLTRYQAVVEQHLIPQQQVDDQRALVEQLRGTVQSDKAQIESARLNIDYAHITSPIDGVTGVRQVDPGNLVHATDTTGIVVLTQMDPIAVLFTLPQDDLPRVARYQAQSHAPLLVQAVSRDGTDLLATGTLELIDNQINQSTATLRGKAVFPNPNHTLWPNQFVRARLQLAVRKGALVVPAVAIQRGPQGTFVYVVGDDQKAALRPVELDSAEGLLGDQAVIAKGLAPGDRVVIDGQSQLRPGAKVVVSGGGGPGGSGSGGGAGKGAHKGGRPPQ
jgi:multidrug efflux system membrane fusion protein